MTPRAHHLPTIAAISSAAFALADVAHESLGHGGAYVLLGGRSFLLTTTKMIPDAPGVDPDHMFAATAHGELYGRIFSIAGPLGSFILAALALLLLHRLRSAPRPHLKLFLWLAAAWSLLWAGAYMISSPLLADGDYYELVRALPHEAVLRALLVAAGIVTYHQSLRILSALLPATGLGEAADLPAEIFTAWLDVFWLACLAAAFDPRGPSRILHDALPLTLIANSGIFLLRPPRTIVSTAPATLDSSLPWLIAGAIACALFIAVLGPGLAVRL